MSKIDYLTEDNINPPDQKFICVSFFSKKILATYCRNKSFFFHTNSYLFFKYFVEISGTVGNKIVRLSCMIL